MSTVVISRSDDQHIDYVQKHLEQPLIVIDVQKIRTKQSNITFAQNKLGLFEVIVQGRPLQGIKGVWFRKPELIIQAHQVAGTDVEGYVKSSLRNFSNLVRTRFPDAIWVSDPYAILRACDKLVQLELAAKLGFNIPHTIVTSSEADARKFIDSQQQVIAKPVEAQTIANGKERPAIFFARRLDKHNIDLSGLHLAPAIFQQAIDVQTDIRVTTVGNKVFAAAITVQGEAGTGVRDWRLHDPCKGVKFETFDLPTRIAKLCTQHMKSLGLNFSAIDLVLDKKGKIWFLENNPNGQWAFVEDAVGLPIGKAIAQLLVRG